MNFFNIRHAVFADEEKIINFIKTDWKADHIFVKDQDFFRYQYEDVGSLNFFIAEHGITREIIGILGYINYSENCKSSDIFLALWKVRSHLEDPFLGVKLLDYLIKDLDPQRLHCVGINKKTTGIYKYMGYLTGAMDHYFYLNKKTKTFKIAYFPEESTNEFISESLDVFSSDYTLDLLDGQEDLKQAYEKLNVINMIPSKSFGYLRKRYLLHPIYKYQIFALKEKWSDKCVAIVFLREVVQNQTKVLRMIDFVGSIDKITYLLNKITNYVDENSYEYMDFYCAGIDKELLKTTPLKNLKDFKNVVIPNYFEPFVQQNIDIFYFTNCKENFYFFKGDGDQDRPNIPRGKNEC